MLWASFVCTRRDLVNSRSAFTPAGQNLPDKSPFAVCVFRFRSASPQTRPYNRGVQIGVPTDLKARHSSRYNYVRNHCCACFSCLPCRHAVRPVKDAGKAAAEQAQLRRAGRKGSVCPTTIPASRLQAYNIAFGEDYHGKKVANSPFSRKSSLFRDISIVKRGTSRRGLGNTVLALSNDMPL